MLGALACLYGLGQTVNLTLLRDVDGKLERRFASAMLADRYESMSKDNDLVPRETKKSRERQQRTA